MTESRYPQSLIESLLVRSPFPERYRTMPQRLVGSPLGELQEHVELPGVLEPHGIALLL